MLIGLGLPALAVAQDEAASDDAIIVTGSRIPSANAISNSPVTTIGSAELNIRGTTRVEDMINTLPQAFAAQGAATSNGANGTAQVALRGLGANRTLVLIDGRRMGYGTAFGGASGASAAPDLNQIPAGLIDRVEVLTGGASAVYGSDAIAGVVNFRMIDNFEGVRISGQLSGYQHSNNNAAAQARLNDFGAAVPEDGVFDGKGQEITAIMGANSSDGRGNVTAYASYRNDDSVFQADRDYSACAYGGGDPDFGCSGSSTTPNGRFFTNYGDFTLDEATPNGGGFRPYTGADSYNFAPTNFYQRPDERFTLGAFGHYEVNDHLDFYTQLMMYHYQSDAQIAYTGTFFTTSQVNCDNPLIGTTPNAAGFSQLDYLCGAPDPGADGFVGTVGPDMIAGTADDILLADVDDPGTAIPGSGDTGAGDVLLYPGKRLVESNPRNDHIVINNFRGVFGLRGDAMPGWKYDAYFQYSQTENNQQYENDGVIPNMQNALFAVSDGAGGVQCREASARAQGCVPLNLFQIGGVTSAQLPYITQTSFQTGRVQQYVAEGDLTGDLGQYGMQMPWADEGVGIVFGFQWRKDSLNYLPDSLFQNGLLSGQGGPTPAVNGAIENTDFYTEAEIPLITGRQGFERLSFNGSYRHSNVSTGSAYSTWKLAGDWQILPEIRVRGGWQRAARAPNIFEAFSPQSIGLTTLPTLSNGETDPCAGDLVFTDTDGDGNDDVGAPTASSAACANTGVTAAQYGHIVSNPAAQYNGLFGGNPNLNPEVSDTYTIGAVFTPGDRVPGNLLVSADYYDINVEGYISAVSAETSLNQCLDTGIGSAGTVPICDAVHRNSAGSLWINQNGVIDGLNLNTGSVSTKGIDFNANYSFDLDDMGMGDAGSLVFDFVGTKLLNFKITELPGGLVATYDCAGFYGGRCSAFTGAPNPTWRHKLRTTWQMPIGVDFSVTWRYYGSVQSGDSVNGTLPATNLNSKLSSRQYIDLAGSYNVTDNWNVRLGVNNVMDKDPPVTTQTAGFSNGNTYPQTWDALGRYLFLGTTVDF